MKVNYPETILEKSSGLTSAEEYLYRLCNNTFLSFWSFPNIFRDQGRTNSKRSSPKGDGKEVCDLLVVFGEHVFIFSDKNCAFQQNDNIEISWSRWYKKAVKEAATQLWGAERWIFDYPDNLYLNKNCTTKFPFDIPDRKNAIIHRIVVAHGASYECIKQLGGSGSLMLNPYIIGDMHMLRSNSHCIPFTLGQIDPSKGYVHIFDDVSLEIVMKTLDTITDFASYLRKKEEFVKSGKLFIASGEDDLLAFYLQRADASGAHMFIDSNNNEVDAITISEGLWKSFSNSKSRQLQIKANDISYSWDRLIEKFVFHITTGTSYRLSHPDLKNQEKVFRLLVRENRTRRRLLAKAIYEQIAKTGSDNRSTRLIIPTVKDEPFYLFLLLPRTQDISNERYREVRSELLDRYMRVTKLKYPDAKDIIGLATESGFCENRSEDFMYLDARNWTNAENIEAVALEKELIANNLLGKRQFFRGKIKEYPTETHEKVTVGMKGKERNSPCPCGSGKKFKKCCGSLI